MNLFDIDEVIDGLEYFPNFLPRHEASEFYQRLLSSVSFKQQNVLVGGKVYPQPRLTAWYGDPDAYYKYSGVKNQPEAWLPELLEIRNRLKDHMGYQFNSVLINFYRDGQDSVAYHADDEPMLGPEWPENIVIASISLGNSRRFVLKRNKDGFKKEYNLVPGSLLVMSKDIQRYWRHSIPKTKKFVGERINLTYRIVCP